MIPNYKLMENLIILAKMRGFTLEDFEKRIGTTNGYIKRHTKGRAREDADIRFNIFRKSAEVLKLELSELFKYLEKLDAKEVKSCPVCNKTRHTNKILLEKIKDNTYYCHLCKTEFRFLKKEG